MRTVQPHNRAPGLGQTSAWNVSDSPDRLFASFGHKCPPETDNPPGLFAPIHTALFVNDRKAQFAASRLPRIVFICTISGDRYRKNR